VYVYVYVYVCVCVCVHGSLCEVCFARSVFKNVCMCMCVYLCACMCMCVCVCARARARVCMCMYMCMCVCVCAWVSLWGLFCKVSFQKCVCVYVCVLSFQMHAVLFRFLGLFSDVHVSFYIQRFFSRYGFFRNVGLFPDAWVSFQICRSLFICVGFFSDILVSLLVSFKMYMVLFKYGGRFSNVYTSFQICRSPFRCVGFFSYVKGSFQIYWSLLRCIWFFSDMWLLSDVFRVLSIYTGLFQDVNGSFFLYMWVVFLMYVVPFQTHGFLFEWINFFLDIWVSFHIF